MPTPCEQRGKHRWVIWDGPIPRNPMTLPDSALSDIECLLCETNYLEANVEDGAFQLLQWSNEGLPSQAHIP